MADIIYDLSKRLTTKRPEVKFDDDHIFKINNTKNGVILMDQAIKQAERLETLEEKLNAYDNVIGHMLGNDAKDFIQNSDFGLNVYEVVFKTITAAISNKTYEEVEAEEKEAEFRS